MSDGDSTLDVKGWFDEDLVAADPPPPGGTVIPIVMHHLRQMAPA
jgi:hypothetical protein